MLVSVFHVYEHSRYFFQGLQPYKSITVSGTLNDLHGTFEALYIFINVRICTGNLWWLADLSFNLIFNEIVSCYLSFCLMWCAFGSIWPEKYRWWQSGFTKFLNTGEAEMVGLVADQGPWDEKRLSDLGTEISSVGPSYLGVLGYVAQFYLAPYFRLYNK